MDIEQAQRIKIKDVNADYNSIMKVSNECSFNKLEMEAIFKLFKRFDVTRSCQVPFHDLLEMLRDFGYIVDQKCKEKIFKDLEDRNQHKLDFQATLFVFRVTHEYERFLKKQEQENMSSEYIDAFVALGGNPDSSGYVKKYTILDILSNEFELTFDMDDLLERIEVQTDDIDFNDFKKLFKITDDPKSLTKNSSVLSLLSQRSRVSSKTTSSVQTVKIRMRDFDKYVQKLEVEQREKDLVDTNSVSNTMSPIKR